MVLTLLVVVPSLKLGQLIAQTIVGRPAFVVPDQSPYLASEGKVALEWQIEGGDTSLQYELQQSNHTGFDEAKTRYLGMDQGSYISGLPEGDFFFRVRVVDGAESYGDWSEPMEIQVRYVSMQLVYWLMGIGMLVFVATVLTVVTGHKRALRMGGTSH